MLRRRLAALEHPSVCGAFQQTVRAQGDRIALRTKADDTCLTWSEYGERVARVAAALAGLGVRRGTAVCLMLSDRPEFHIVDAAAMHLGATTCSIYNSSSEEQVAYVLDDAGARMLVTEAALLPAALPAARRSPLVDHVVVVDGEAPSGTLSLEGLDQVEAPDGFDFDAAWRAVRPDDLLTLIYTSGTTGPPKGVQLTHGAALAAGRGFLEVVPLDTSFELVSYLPMAHVAERCCSHWLPMVLGCTVTCCPNPRDVVAYLPDVRPHWLFSVPRVWEKLKTAIEAGVAAAEPEQGDPMRRALTLGIRAAQARRGSARPLSRSEEEERRRLDDTALAPLRAGLGLDRLGAAHVGAAPTPLPVLDFFDAFGIPLGEIWGMSELCAASCVNRPGG